MRTESSPSPSLLLFLFADKLIPVVPYKLGLPLRAPHPVPCKGAMVEQVALAETLLAVAFWSLREQGVVALQPCASRKMLLVPSTAVRVSLCPDARAAATLAVSHQEKPVGLEAAIRNALVQGHEGEDVHAVIRAVAAGGDENPHAMFIHRAAWEATVVGLLQFGTQGHHLPGDLDCARVAALEARADEVLARWRDFQSSEPVLHLALVKSCASGLKSLRQTPASRPVPPGAFAP
jgi:hypothetical protein